jgi:XTP/dITP diphosphohydrolase
MRKLLIATTNKGKLKEIAGFLKDLPAGRQGLDILLLSLSDLGISDDVEETGRTYKENSQLKAKFYAKKSNLPSISDDGGLEIEALGGAPGVKSKRWLGDSSTEEDIVKHMTKVAKELPDKNRNAKFKTVISLALPSGKTWSVTGEIRGIIAKKPFLKLLKGYPYRSFFYLPEIKKYYHENELTEKEQKLYNHRYKAIQKLKTVIAKELIN